MPHTKPCVTGGRAGNIFEPWSNMEFDTIVNDVAGIAEIEDFVDATSVEKICNALIQNGLMS